MSIVNAEKLLRMNTRLGYHEATQNRSLQVGVHAHCAQRRQESHSLLLQVIKCLSIMFRSATRR